MAQGDLDVRRMVADEVVKRISSDTMDADRAKATQMDASPELRAYEKAIGPYAQDQGLSNYILTCHFRDDAWFGAANRTIRAAIEQDDQIRQLYGKLDHDELVVASAYSDYVAHSEYEFWGGMSPKSCANVTPQALARWDAIAAGSYFR